MTHEKWGKYGNLSRFLFLLLVSTAVDISLKGIRRKNEMFVINFKL